MLFPLFYYLVLLNCGGTVHSYYDKFEGQNNVCKSLEDYQHAENNVNCWYNPDTVLDVPDLVMKYFGVLETYKITTDDGYILTMFRIPRANPKGVILLQHPISSNSNTFFFQGNESLPYFLWNEGYEIWLNNERGTKFSFGHVNLSAFEIEYWDFGFHEIALYDVPKEIELIRSKTDNSKIIFFGHSMGTTVGLIYASLNHQKAKEEIEGFIFAGVTCYYKYNKSPIILISRFQNGLRYLFFNVLRLGYVWPIVPTLAQIFRVVSRKFPGILYFLNLLDLFTVGKNELDYRFLNFDVWNILRDIPCKVFYHLFQLMREKTRFQWYDYGKAENIKRYGTPKPPLYPIENITIPIFMMYATEDLLTTKEDSLYFYDRLNDKAKFGKLAMEGMNHVDVHFGRNRKEKFYNGFLKALNKFLISR